MKSYSRNRLEMWGIDRQGREKGSYPLIFKRKFIFNETRGLAMNGGEKCGMELRGSDRLGGAR